MFCLIKNNQHLISLQHIFGHHPYTNIDGFDPDISTAQHVSVVDISFFSLHVSESDGSCHKNTSAWFDYA